MKKLLLFLAILCSLNAGAQSADTCHHIYVVVQPDTVTLGDPNCLFNLTEIRQLVCVLCHKIIKQTVIRHELFAVDPMPIKCYGCDSGFIKVTPGYNGFGGIMSTLPFRVECNPISNCIIKAK